MSKLSELWGNARLRADSSRISRKSSLSPALLFAAGTLCASSFGASAAPVVATQEGVVQGFINKGVAEFLGVPYAEPPIGNLRWKPSKKHEAWAGVLKATAFGPTCAQIVTLGVFAGPANNNEDCLYLNVFTPNLNPSAKLPVIFWIHGGGNVDGESNDYDASKLASDGKTVVVTINYRLNLMGFLAHPALDKEGHLFGNYGILDQQLALKWVKRNIAKFGGDKDNVTVGGQSAGATDTGIHVISPLSDGLFDRALYESSVPINELPLSLAETRSTAFAVAAGCGAGADSATAKCLRGLTGAQVEALAGTASGNSAYVNGPLVDGTIIPIQPIAAWHNGQFKHMPMMNGRVEDEQNFTLAITEYFSGPPRAPLTAAQYTAFINTTYSAPNPVAPGVPYPAGTAASILAAYPVSAYASPQLAWDAAVTDLGACATQHVNQILAPQTQYYAYEFDERTAPFYFPKMPGFVSLAYHTSDIQYLFPLYHGGSDGIIHSLNNKQEDLSDQLVAAWTNFAWTGNPNGLGNYPWPHYVAGKKNAPNFLSENIPVLSTFTDAQYAANHNCAFWSGILPYTYGPAY